MRPLWLLIFLLHVSGFKCRCVGLNGRGFCDSDDPPVTDAINEGGTKSETNLRLLRDWLETQRRDEPETDGLNESAEGGSRGRDTATSYCRKYEKNYDGYCRKTKAKSLEGFLPHFCKTYASNCLEEGGLTGKDDTLIESDPKDKASLGVVRFQTEEQKGGSVSAAEAKDYCKQFGPSFDRICRGGILKTQKDTIDFCTNYATTCEGIQTDSHTDGEPKRASKADKMGFIQMKHADREKEDEQEESKTEEEPEPDLSLEDLNDDDLKSLETLHTSKQSTTTEKPKRNMEIDEYCEKYSENYNYYCAGEDPENPQQGFCKSYEKHCPDKVETKKNNPEFLGEKSEKDHLYLYKGTRDDYCQKFSVNYEYYCKGEQTDTEISSKFCPSYRKGCLEQVREKQPPNPFSEDKGKPKPAEKSEPDPNFPDFDNPTLDGGAPRKTSHLKPKVGKLRKRPCTPDCDQKFFPHCTADCKCDYLYPYVQKFCNPPPLPFFLNTCRLWYNGCPKYERYHYASQFIYSKAEKGKTVGQFPPKANFNIISPSGEQIPVSQPQSHWWRHWTERTSRKRRSILSTIIPQLEAEPEPEPLLIGIVHRNFPRSPHLRSFTSNATTWPASGYRLGFLQTSLRTKRSLPKDVVFWSNIKQKKKDDGFVHWKQKEKYVVINGTVLPLPADVPKARFGKDQVEGGGPGPIDKRQVPIVATDSVFSDPNLSQNFGAFTDPHGILHRPRSRSPFTKPGLWEPNPDNPHNRDHANKWYYHPRSVTADWLNGQVAWGAHWGVPAAGVGGTDGFSAIYFPTVGTFFNIPDDYD